jgi:hypothetical protein
MKKFYVLLRVFVSVEIIGALIFAFGVFADVNGKPYGTKLGIIGLYVALSCHALVKSAIIPGINQIVSMRKEWEARKRLDKENAVKK